MAGPQVRHLDRLILQAAKDTGARPGQASDASAVPDAVRLDVALLTRGLEVVRGSHPSAWVGAQAEKVACRGQFPLLGALPPMVVYQCLVPDAVEECLPQAVGPERRFETVLGAV